ncbi:hypothetical protein HK096_005744, partial [Nowakowskiella sp. JEL0078]
MIRARRFPSLANGYYRFPLISKSSYFGCIFQRFFSGREKRRCSEAMILPNMSNELDNFPSQPIQRPKS